MRVSYDDESCGEVVDGIHYDLPLIRAFRKGKECGSWDLREEGGSPFTFVNMEEPYPRVGA